MWDLNTYLVIPGSHKQPQYDSPDSLVFWCQRAWLGEILMGLSDINVVNSKILKFAYD